MISDYEHKINVDRMKSLNDAGYIFYIASDGYKVMHKNVFVGAAGVILPRTSHTRRTQKIKLADFRDYFASAVSIAEKHYQKNKVENNNE